MTEYEKIYEDIADRPGGPYIRLLTLLPGESSPSSMKTTKPEEDWPLTWDESLGDFVASVKPADWSDEPSPSDLEVELSAHSLNDNPEYEALSYTWGKENDYKFTIKCNGHNFVALRQMHNALHALRLPDRPRVLWIDAICINQSKYEDKNCQLPLMERIYRGSKRTVIWLGAQHERNIAPPFVKQAETMGGLPDPDLHFLVGSFEKFLAINLETLATDPEELWRDHPEVKPTWDKRLDLIKETARRVQEDWATRENPPSTDFGAAIDELMAKEMAETPKILRSAGKYIMSRPRYRNTVRQGMAMTDGQSWRGSIRNLLCREWWSRVWIIQEVCLSPEIIFICDDTTLSLDFLFLGMVLYSVFPEDLLSRGHILSSWTLPQVVEYRALQSQKGGARPLPGFLHLLNEFRLSDATNPRDHVYALLGLVPPHEQSTLGDTNYKPDYSKDVRWCYMETARVICEISGNLDIFSIARAPARIASTSDAGPLPSWVPDWAVKVEVPSPKHGIEPREAGGSESLFSACGTCNSWAPQIRENGHLVISGYVTDTITETVTHTLPFLADLVDTLMKLTGADGDPETLAQMENAGMRDMLMILFASIGDTTSILLEWDVFAMAKGKSYPTGEDIKQVSCAVRCFGYLPDGPEAAMSAYKEYMNAFWLARKVYNLTSSSSSSSSSSPPPSSSSSSSTNKRFSLPFFKSNKKSKETSSPEPSDETPPEKKENPEQPSKRRQALLALSAPNDKSKLVKFNSMQIYSLGRKLAWTEKGYLALVAEDTAPGDKILLCKGSKLPLVVKEAGTETGTGEQQPNHHQWKFVDSCYVHGIMGGEAWDESLCEEMELV